MKYETLWHRLTGIYDTDEAKAIVRWALDVRFGFSLTDIVCGKIDEMSETELSELEAMMQRLEKAEPVQYVVGIAEFCGRTFHVEPGVLIPRPETGELCRWIVEERWREGVRREGEYQVLDVGTGSGCIAITLALEMPQAKVTAWDISDDALRIAKKNAEALGAEVTFEKRDALNHGDLNHGDRHSDLRCATIIEPVPMIHPVPMIQQWDAIVSNPPYVCQKEAATMERHVLEHEPHLKSNGLLYFELNPLYAYDTESMVREQGYTETEIKLDMFGKQRFLKAKKI